MLGNLLYWFLDCEIANNGTVVPVELNWLQWRNCAY